MRRIILMLGLATGVWSGCMKTNEPGPAVVHEALTEHRPLRAEKATRQLGEDCTEAGDSACVSGVCLHVKPGRKEGYVCSRACQDDKECPGGWSCAQVYPTPTGRLCMPPRSEQGAAPAQQ